MELSLRNAEVCHISLGSRLNCYRDWTVFSEASQMLLCVGGEMVYERERGTNSRDREGVQLDWVSHKKSIPAMIPTARLRA